MCYLFNYIWYHFCPKLFPVFLASKILGGIQAFWNQSGKNISCASKFSRENSCIHTCWGQLATEHICRKKEGLGVLVENKLSMRQQCTVVLMKVCQVLDRISMNVGNRLRKELFLLYSISLKLHLEYRASFWSFYYKIYSNKLKQVQQSH